MIINRIRFARKYRQPVWYRRPGISKVLIGLFLGLGLLQLSSTASAQNSTVSAGQLSAANLSGGTQTVYGTISGGSLVSSAAQVIMSGGIVSGVTVVGGSSYQKSSLWEWY